MSNRIFAPRTVLLWSVVFAAVLTVFVTPSGPRLEALSSGSCQASPDGGCCTCGDDFCEDGALTGGIVCDDDYCPTSQPHCWVQPSLH